MIGFPENPPQPVSDDLAALRASLDAEIPAKSLDRNVLIATWNIRAFGNPTPKWSPSASDSPKRGLGHVKCIAEIVSRFDVVALQEVKRDLGGLRLLMQALGPAWGWMLSDTTRGAPGNQERMAFVYDQRRVRPSGLAAELVVPLEAKGVTTSELDKQFARTPYAVSFESQGATFTLVTVHIIFGDATGARLPEIQKIAAWLAGWVDGDDEFGANLMALGDFNIDNKQNDPLFQAFVATGLRPAPEHADLPRTIFDKPTKKHFYDQIAWFTDANGKSRLSLPLVYKGVGGHFDFRPALQGQLSNVELSWRISDHFPLWASFSVRGGT